MRDGKKYEIFFEKQQDNAIVFTRTVIFKMELVKNADIVRFIKSRRMAWLGHVMRMDEREHLRKY